MLESDLSKVPASPFWHPSPGCVMVRMFGRDREQDGLPWRIGWMHSSSASAGAGSQGANETPE
jgi:hypothetical protein